MVKKYGIDGIALDPERQAHYVWILFRVAQLIQL
jgi:hypothetical protein